MTDSVLRAAVFDPEGNPPTDRGITQELRDRLAEISDGLIPATGKMPAPSEIGIAGRQLAAALRSRPDLQKPLVRALAAADDVRSPIDWMNRLQEQDPAAHEAVTLVVVAGYYMHPMVRELLGYPGQVGREVSANVFPKYVEEGLLDPVIERGPIYREVPDDQA